MSDQHLSTEQLQQFLDQKSADTEVRQHLAQCERCSSQMKEVERLFGMLTSLQDEALQRDLSPGVLGAIREKKSAQVRIGWLVALEGMLAILVALLIAPTLIDQYGSAVQLFEWMPDSGALTPLVVGTWEALKASVFSLTNGLRFDALDVVDSLVSYPWVWLIAIAGLLWAGGNGLMLRLLNGAE